MAILGITCSEVEFLQLETYFKNNKKSAETMGEFYSDILLRKICKNKMVAEVKEDKNNDSKKYEDQSIFFKSIIKK